MQRDQTEVAAQSPISYIFLQDMAFAWFSQLNYFCPKLEFYPPPKQGGGPKPQKHFQSKNS